MRDVVTAGRRWLAVAAIAVLIAASCSGDDATDPIVPWSQDPCGVAPPQDVAAAFGIDPVPDSNTPRGECRYLVGDTLLRVTVLADSDACAGIARSAAARNESLQRPESAPDGVFVIEPVGDVVVCAPALTYVLSAGGRAAPLLTLAGLGVERRAR